MAADGKKKEMLQSKMARRRQKKKLEKLEAKATAAAPEGASSATDEQSSSGDQSSSAVPDKEDEPIAVEYVSAKYAPEEDDNILEQFADVFSKFASAEELTGRKEVAAADAPAAAEEDAAAAEDEAAKELSKKKKKVMARLSVAELKQVVQRPDVVEAHDVTAADSRLLVYLKSYRNAVPVPRHWCHKRKYLQGKRGVEKKPWQLPEFIAQTGIEKIRQAVMAKDEEKRTKQSQRDRVAPKMGRMDVDYQVLHDAFFKWQTKPPLTRHGELYYEGREFEVHLKEKRPGTLGAAMKAALGMPDGAPPPWLINMQRYGPPPSYPNLRVAGLNAPIPDGAQFGYHPGGWGKPPVDEYGRPLYGDVFGGHRAAGGIDPAVAATVVTDHWGEMAEAEEEEEEEDEEDDDDAPAPRQPRRRTAAADDDTDLTGTETPLDDGASSVISGLETPDAIDLRKRAGLDTPDTSGISSAQSGEQEKALYRVLDEQKARGPYGQGTLFGSDKRYDVSSGVAATLDPDSLEADLGQDALQGKLRAGGGGNDSPEDVRGKRKRDGDAAAAKAKKSKDFRF